MTAHHGVISAAAARRMFTYPSRHIGRRVRYTLYHQAADGRDCAGMIWDARGDWLGGFIEIGPNGIIPIDPKQKREESSK